MKMHLRCPVMLMHVQAILCFVHGDILLNLGEFELL